ncbi:MAG: stage V sporulation protein SpoVM [Clostridia bacterium]|nr:stage V sporulation protein SpoVM [Clostridia bacterium]
MRNGCLSFTSPYSSIISSYLFSSNNCARGASLPYYSLKLLTNLLLCINRYGECSYTEYGSPPDNPERETYMKIVLVRSPKFLSGILRRLFGIKGK